MMSGLGSRGRGCTIECGCIIVGILTIGVVGLVTSAVKNVPQVEGVILQTSGEIS